MSFENPDNLPAPGDSGADITPLVTGTDRVDQYNDTNAQAFYLYNTRTDASNYENVALEFVGNIARLNTRGAGTGSARMLQLCFGSNRKVEISNTYVYHDTETLLEGDTYPNTDNTYDCGTASKRWDDIYATNTTIQSSDANLKENIKPLSLGLNLVNELRPVSYKWKDYEQEITEPDGTVKGTKTVTHSRKHAGLIAQEFKDALEKLGVDVNKFAAYVDPTASGGEGPLGIRYTELIPVLIKAVQELSARVEALES